MHSQRFSSASDWMQWWLSCFGNIIFLQTSEYYHSGVEKAPQWFYVNSPKTETVVSSENNFTCCTDKYFEKGHAKLLVQIPCVNFHEGTCNFHIFTFTSSHYWIPWQFSPSLSQIHPITALSGGFISRDGKPGLKILCFIFHISSYLTSFLKAIHDIQINIWVTLSGKKEKMCDIRKMYVNTKFSFFCQVTLYLDWLQLYTFSVSSFKGIPQHSLIIHLVHSFLTSSRVYY